VYLIHHRLPFLLLPIFSIASSCASRTSTVQSATTPALDPPAPLRQFQKPRFPYLRSTFLLTLPAPPSTCCSLLEFPQLLALLLQLLHQFAHNFTVAITAPPTIHPIQCRTPHAAQRSHCPPSGHTLLLLLQLHLQQLLLFTQLLHFLHELLLVLV
jgi:hypothetical protein